MIVDINKTGAQDKILSQNLPPAIVFSYLPDVFYVIPADPNISPEGRLAAAIKDQRLSDDQIIIISSLFQAATRPKNAQAGCTY